MESSSGTPFACAVRACNARARDLSSICGSLEAAASSIKISSSCLLGKAKGPLVEVADARSLSSAASRIDAVLLSVRSRSGCGSKGPFIRARAGIFEIGVLCLLASSPSVLTGWPGRLLCVSAVSGWSSVRSDLFGDVFSLSATIDRDRPRSHRSTDRARGTLVGSKRAASSSIASASAAPPAW